MAWQRGMRRLPSGGYVAPVARIADRLDLEVSPRAETIEAYGLTRAAGKSWHAINLHLESDAGVLFWIRGPAGCGKTHFLNDAIALQQRAGAAATASSRQIVCGFELVGHARQSEIEAYLMTVLAEQIGVHREGDDLWRGLKGGAAIEVALAQAARVGIRSITIAIDLGLAESQAEDYFVALADAAEKSRRAKLTIMVASRSHPPRGAVALGVAPADERECISVALSRSRTVSDEIDEFVTRAYLGLEMNGFDPRTIYPFHPETLRPLAMLAGPPATIAAIAQLANDGVAAWLKRGSNSDKLIYVSDLMECAPIEHRVTARLGDAGASAFKTARAAAATFVGHEASLANEIVSALAIDHAAGGLAPLSVDALPKRVAILAGRGAEAWTRAALSGVLARIAELTRGVIRFELGAARFDPSFGDSPEVAAFNAALPIAIRFDATLSAARDLPELRAKLMRLDNAMAAALDLAARVERTLGEAARDANTPLSGTENRAIGDFISLAARGSRAILEVGADAKMREEVLASIGAYEALAAAAAMIPRMRAMREYLVATGLRATSGESIARDPALAALETECELLMVEAGPRALSSLPRSIEGLEARFQKFKWTYVQHYRASHQVWREELARLQPLLDDARRYVEVLNRLNAISALGQPEGTPLERSLAEVMRRAARCGYDGPLAPEITPRCPGCDYKLGDTSQRQSLADVADALKRALNTKLAALSESMIAAVIREHDVGHRLEGVLKIIQASQTDALVRVLDERLARYLAQLLDENLGAALAAARPPMQLVDASLQLVDASRKPDPRKLTRGSGASRSRAK
jgi:hypothetical protein